MKDSKMGDDGDETTEEKEDDNKKRSGLNGKDPLQSVATSVARNDEKGLQQSTTVFVFWAYVAAFVSLLTLSVVIVSSIIPSDEETEFFSMPPDVRQHFTEGKLLKIEVGKDRFPLKVFVREEGPLLNSETVLLCHGLAASSFTYRSVISSLASRGLHVIAMDFPGAGLSEKPALHQGGIFSNLREIYEEILQKGLFWRFEQMFETGAFPDPVSASNELGLRYDASDLSESIAQVVSLLAPSPVHIVLHDTSVEAGLTWAVQNRALLRSITLLDTYSGTPSFPAGVLRFPGVGSLILRTSFLLQQVLRFCCVTHITQVEADSHAFLLRIKGGQEATLQTWEMTNKTFDLISSIKELGELPMQLVWSNNSGKRWQELGDWLVSQLPGALNSSHKGGRWPQEDEANRVSEELYRFITSLPPVAHSFGGDVKVTDEEERFVANSDHMDSDGHKFHTCDHGHGYEHGHDETHNVGHIHDHGLGYMNQMGHGGWVV